MIDDKLKGLVPFLPLQVPPPRPPTPLAVHAASRPAGATDRGRQPMNRLSIAAVAILAVAAVVLSSALFIVKQTEQVLVLQFGEIVRPIEDPGLHAKLPFIQNVVTFDRRLLNVDLPGEEVILGDQRRLIVDTFTVFRITDPLRFYQAIGPVPDNIRGRLNSIVTVRCAACWATTRCLTCCPPTVSGSCQRSAAR